MFVSIVRNVVFYDFENPGHLASRAEFCGTPGHSSLKPIKLGLSSENRDEWGPMCAETGGTPIYQSSLGLVPFTLEESTRRRRFITSKRLVLNGVFISLKQL
jgi:hypothetical protein